MQDISERPPLGVRKKCGRCGRSVWLRQAGTIGLSDQWPRGTKVYSWYTRKGSKDRHRCPVSDGWPMTYHRPEGHETMYYVKPTE